MRRETLDAIVKLRQQAITDAKTQLAAAIAEESRAQAKAQDADQRLSHEADVASDVTAGDEVVEAYARWLPKGLGQAADARSNWDAANLEVTHARATLDAARAAAEMAEEAVVASQAAEAANRQRREQLELDDCASRKHPRS